MTHFYKWSIMLEKNVYFLLLGCRVFHKFIRSSLLVTMFKFSMFLLMFLCSWSTIERIIWKISCFMGIVVVMLVLFGYKLSHIFRCIEFRNFYIFLVDALSVMCLFFYFLKMILPRILSNNNNKGIPAFFVFYSAHLPFLLHSFWRVQGVYFKLQLLYSLW